MCFDDFFQGIYGKNVAVLGVGISNMPLIRLLVKYGGVVTAYDKKPLDAIEPAIRAELFHHSVPIVSGESYLDNIEGDLIFRTPGLRPDHPGILKAVAHGAVLTSEMELFFKLCPCPIIGITGSDGKTTTTTIISEILKKAGKTVHIGGNIGTPLLDRVPDISGDHYCVVELSSFQLMTMSTSPQIAVITNISPNHLDVHTDMAEYVRAKENIFLHQQKGDRLVLNRTSSYTDNQLTRAGGTALLFSPKTPMLDGVCCDGKYIYFAINGAKHSVLALKDIKLVGWHNVENYMAAIAALWGIVPVENMVEVAREFNGVEHRIELVRKVMDISYYNDSIASSPTRTIAGLKSFTQPTILIAGGSDKNIPFSGLASEIVNRTKGLILVGATADKIEAAVVSCPSYSPTKLPIIRCNTLKEAVAAAHALATSGDIVIMSPACASFDMYKNFMERGNLFKEIVNQL